MTELSVVTNKAGAHLVYRGSQVEINTMWK